ncbi:hypothetical protein JKP88DRAFT_256211 [Tribonema minus]|uniref:Uncharacterized protein n=1 Tax=Tribonema minus TaxID=303371 RepID=A0A836CBX7_9STRA|nr:hypothetical protein JKP88DRAFT_247664 [Tribonema minus]KAG5180069.1 hypothetical protein JKP88DRAFT_256211 [Tribonema minus]
MGSAYSRNQQTIDKDFSSNPNDIGRWDHYHVRMLHEAFIRNGCGFSLDKQEFSALLCEALPAAKNKAQQLWSIYADGKEDAIYPVELCFCLLLQCRGQSRQVHADALTPLTPAPPLSYHIIHRDKAGALFDLVDLSSTAAVTPQELSLLCTLLARAVAAVVADAAAPLKSRPHDSDSLTPSVTAAVDVPALVADAFRSAGNDAAGAAKLPRDAWLAWVTCLPGCELDADVELEAAAHALGMAPGRWRRTRAWHEA